MSDVDAVTTETPFTSTPDPDAIAKMVAEAVAKVEAEKRGPAVKPIHCQSCYEWTTQYGLNSVCIGCSSRGLGPQPDYVLCRRLGMPVGIFFPGIASTLSILSKTHWEEPVTITDLLDESKTSFEQLADLFDHAQKVNGNLPYKRALTIDERAAKESEASDRIKRDTRRSLLSQRSGLVKQLDDFNTRLEIINAKLEELGEDVG